MNRLFRAAAVILAALSMQDVCSAQFYKDVFQDSGINITSRKDLPAVRMLGLTMETYYSANHNPMELSAKDTLEQTAKMVTSDLDYNGCLLYPDGAPRFRMIYENGGSAGAHGRSLTEQGLENIRQFYYNGGSYVGSCAGAFISSKHFTTKMDSIPEGERKEYLHIYPALTKETELEKGADGIFPYTDHSIEPGSPLLKYFDFGGDMKVANVLHNGGAFLFDDDPRFFAPGTEILTRYLYDKDDKLVAEGKYPLTGKVSTWAYKADEKSGRLVDCGSHPEIETEGERMEWFASFLLYAMDGNGKPQVKAQLANGVERRMVKDTKDNDPAFTKIGDKQYHHFTVSVPKKAKNVKVTLSCPVEGIDLYLSAKKDDFAFIDGAKYKDVTFGGNKEMSIDNSWVKVKGKKQPKSTLWYIGVQCATTVTEVATDYGVAYTGKTEVLNGIPYTIKVTWDE